MGRFLTPYEAADMLRVNVKALKIMGIHQCPQGYHTEQIKWYCSKHGLPIGDAWHAISVGKEIEGVRFCKSAEEALLKTNLETRALLLEANEPLLPIIWGLIKETGIRLISVGEEHEECHVSIPLWDDAHETIRTMFHESEECNPR